MAAKQKIDCARPNYSDRHTLFAGKVIISHWHGLGGSFKDHRWWMAEFNGEVEDYHLKDELIRQAHAAGRDAVVLRVHRDGTISWKEYPK